MRFPVSSASVPNPLGGALPQPTPRPEIVKPLPPKSRPRGLGWGLAALAIVAGAGLYLKRDRLPPDNGGGGPSAPGFRIAGLPAGAVQRNRPLGVPLPAQAR